MASETTSIEKIPVFGLDDFGTPDEDQRDKEEQFRGVFGWFKSPSQLTYGVGEVDADVLQKRLEALLGKVRKLIENTPAYLGQFGLDSITLTVEISAKGQVSLLGTGGEVGGKGGISFTLKRSPAALMPGPPQPPSSQVTSTAPGGAPAPDAPQPPSSQVTSTAPGGAPAPEQNRDK
jgi:hypothetical protein